MARVRPGEAANPAPPTVQRVRLRFAKRGRLRFLSHRDVARSFERAVRRAGVPVAHSHGFSPHPRLSWIGAAPTGVASEAEYVEIGLTRQVAPAALAAALDSALPDGLDVLAAAVAEGAPLADRIDASRWVVELPGIVPAELRGALAALLARESVVVERVTPSGRREIDVRAALVHADVQDRASAGSPRGRTWTRTGRPGSESSGATHTARATAGEAARVRRSKSSEVTARVRARISSRARSRALSRDSGSTPPVAATGLVALSIPGTGRGRMLSARGATLPALPPPWR